METESISIQGRATMSDYVHAVHAFAARQKGIWLLRIISVLLLLIGLHLLADSKAVGSGIEFIAIGLVGLFDGVQVAMIWLSVKKTGKLRDPFEAEFNETGMVFKMLDAQSEVKWSYYSRVIETHRVFLLCYSKAAFHLIPKHAFKSPEDIEALRELLKRHIG